MAEKALGSTIGKGDVIPRRSPTDVTATLTVRPASVQVHLSQLDKTLSTDDPKFGDELLGGLPLVNSVSGAGTGQYQIALVPRGNNGTVTVRVTAPADTTPTAADLPVTVTGVTAEGYIDAIKANTASLRFQIQSRVSSLMSDLSTYAGGIEAAATGMGPLLVLLGLTAPAWLPALGALAAVSATITGLLSLVVGSDVLLFWGNDFDTIRNMYPLE